ncbi:MAG: 5'-methylthioadenosine/S-adenosylhomocysteine nucleosidase [Alphaproteobacteria bacterium]|nr:5'-methylthioadenosine/S-adenosylhomocysteine nucleosidase [Alphaproteobacteria bacterium]
MLSLLSLVNCSNSSSADDSTPKTQLDPLDTTPRLLIMSAFDAEMDELLNEADITYSYTIKGSICRTGKLAGNDVVMVLCGISMISATLTTQAVIDHFEITGIVFSGIAGGVNPNLHIGDVTVPKQWAQYQEQLFAKKISDTEWDPAGHEVKLLEPVVNFGMMFPKHVIITQQYETEDVNEYKRWFEVDSAMLDTSRKIADFVDLNDCTPEGVCLENDPEIVLDGNGVSGQTFVNNAEYREWVWNSFQADALDMETAAVAHVAYVNDIPYIAFRSVSDLAGGGPGENELGTFFQLAANNSSMVLMKFLEEWAEQ